MVLYVLRSPGTTDWAMPNDVVEIADGGIPAAARNGFLVDRLCRQLTCSHRGHRPPGGSRYKHPLRAALADATAVVGT